MAEEAELVEVAEAEEMAPVLPNRAPCAGEPAACIDGVRVVARISDVDHRSCSFTVSWRQDEEACEVVLNLLELPSVGIALQSVWKEAAEMGDKPGMAEYRSFAWESIFAGIRTPVYARARPLDWCSHPCVDSALWT